MGRGWKEQRTALLDQKAFSSTVTWSNCSEASRRSSALGTTHIPKPYPNLKTIHPLESPTTPQPRTTNPTTTIPQCLHVKNIRSSPFELPAGAGHCCPSVVPSRRTHFPSRGTHPATKRLQSKQMTHGAGERKRCNCRTQIHAFIGPRRAPTIT